MITIASNALMPSSNKCSKRKPRKKAYDKAMAKHRRIKQNVQTTLRNTHDSTQGRLVAKKMKAVLSQKNATTALPKT